MPPRPTRLRGIVPAARRGGSRPRFRMRDRARPIWVRNARSWPRSYHDLVLRRISFAVGWYENPSIGLRERRKRHIARGYGGDVGTFAPHRHEFREADGRGHFVRE